MAHKVENKIIETLSFNGSGSDTSAWLQISFGKEVLSQCPLTSQYELQIVVPNYSEACGEKGKDLFVEVFQFIAAAYMNRTALDLEYTCPIPGSKNSAPWLTSIVAQGKNNPILIPEPPADTKICPLL